MAKLTESELRSILQAEKADALASTQSSKLSKERSDAMDYYNGDVSADIPSIVGRSTVVSTDVSDTIEGMMPQLMEIFAGGDEVVKFAPVGPEDVKAAEQETDYVNHVFMQQNPGFMILYTFIKDALLSKVGIVKIWTEEEEEEEKRTYYDQDDNALAQILNQPGVEVLEHSVSDQGLHDITVVIREKHKCHKVEPVPPEEFGIARRAKSVSDSGYCFHETTTSLGELIEQGYDEDQVNALPSSEKEQSIEQSARDTVDESSAGSGDESLNKTMRPVVATEHYIEMDYERNGKAKLYRVKTAGSQGEVLRRNKKPDIEEIDHIPFAAMTPFPVTHRFFGRSVADLVMDIQRIKTALLRGALDNLYLHNNPRVEVSQSHATDQTLDDLMVSRPGGVVRTKSPGGVTWQLVPDITGSIYPALEYFDATREWRTGVTRQGQGIDANALQNQSATAVNQAFTAAQARIKLIARIFAETGIKNLFSLLHAEIRKHGDKAQTVQLRNQWVTINPNEWRKRSDMTIDVGLGTGGKQQQLANIMALIQLQSQAVQAGLTNLVRPANLYNSAKDLVKIIGKKDVEQYFTDPDAKDPATGQLLNPPQQSPPDPAMMKVQADVQMKQMEMQQRGQEILVKAQLDQKVAENKAEIERIQAQADIATQDRKIQAEMALAQQKADLEAKLKMLDHELKREQHAADMEMKREMHQQAMTQSQMSMAASAQAHEAKMVESKGKAKKNGVPA